MVWLQIGGARHSFISVWILWLDCDWSYTNAMSTIQYECMQLQGCSQHLRTSMRKNMYSMCSHFRISCSLLTSRVFFSIHRYAPDTKIYVFVNEVSCDTKEQVFALVLIIRSHKTKHQEKTTSTYFLTCILYTRTTMMSLAFNKKKMDLGSNMRRGVASITRVMILHREPAKEKGTLLQQWEMNNAMNLQQGCSKELGCYLTPSGKWRSRGNIPS
jgi:hypothetical protein